MESPDRVYSSVVVELVSIAHPLRLDVLVIYPVTGVNSELYNALFLEPHQNNKNLVKIATTLAQCKHQRQCIPISHRETTSMIPVPRVHT